MIRRRSFCAACATPLLAGGHAFALAQGRPPTMVVPYTPGGSTDLLGRMFTDALSLHGGEKYIVENRAGANGTLGAAHVAGAPADGRTLLYAFGNLLLNQEFLMKDLRLRMLDGLVPVARTCVIQAVIVAAASHPARDLREFIALARRSPGRHSYGFFGDFAVPSLAAEAGIDLLRVPYKGGLPGMIDVAAGTVDIIYGSVAQAQPMLRAGKLKVLAVSGDARLSEWPDVPTVKEILPNYRMVDYQVVMAPRGMRAAAFDALVQRCNAVLGAPGLRQAFLERGAVVAPMAAERLRAFMDEDRSHIGKVARLAGILPE